MKICYIIIIIIILAIELWNIYKQCRIMLYEKWMKGNISLLICMLICDKNSRQKLWAKKIFKAHTNFYFLLCFVCYVQPWYRNRQSLAFSSSSRLFLFLYSNSYILRAQCFSFYYTEINSHVRWAIKLIPRLMTFHSLFFLVSF